MLNVNNDVLYIGKAKNLQRRVLNYTQPDRLPNRLQRMVAETTHMEFITTHTDAEALLLESNLIKKLNPRYNILLRDDKSAPYLVMTGLHTFPRLMKYRGKMNTRDKFFGPYVNTAAVDEAIVALQKVFLLRICPDTVLNNRSRPCLQYDIKRCSAPCVNYITPTDYQNLVDQASLFLEGKNTAIQDHLSQCMQDASSQLDYERAAFYRDRLKALAHIQSQQTINTPHLEDGDVIALAQQGGHTCVQLFMFRHGRHMGHHAYFPRHGSDVEAAEVLAAFLGQFYADKPVPSTILLNQPCTDITVVAQALQHHADHPVTLRVPKRGALVDLVKYAEKNAHDALTRHTDHIAYQEDLLEKVAQTFSLPAPPQRIEVYDNSHTQGVHAYGAMIVAGPDGFMKRHYRKFQLPPSVSQKGDDYAMMRAVFRRRFAPNSSSESLPDLILVDGGQGHLSAAGEVLTEMGIDIPLVAIAKGPDRNAGREHFFQSGRPAFTLASDDPVLYYLQRLRDEAHRFVITTHRAKKARSMRQSSLVDIPGVGAARRRALMHHFGSLSGIKNAGVKDLILVKGISLNLAEAIYKYFHEG